MNPQHQQIINLYNEGLSYLKIQKIVKVAPTTVQMVLYSNNVNVRKKDPYKMDLNYFKDIDSHEKAYWLGLIMADGCVTTSRDGSKISKLSISLQEPDGYLLDEFKSQINFEGPVSLQIEKRENKQNSKRISITNQAFVSHFAKFGIKPRKSTTHSFFKEIPQEFLVSAVLGYFDGDGSVHFCKRERRLQASFISSIKFSKDLSKFLLENGIKNSTRIRKTKAGTLMGEVRLKGNCQCLRLHNFLYSNCRTFLKRKKEKFEYVIEEQKQGRLKDTNYLN